VPAPLPEPPPDRPGARDRTAIPVRQDRGVYQLAPDAVPQSWSLVRMVTREQRVVEPLRGWGPYRWAVWTTAGWWFVTGEYRPD
jgi:hypothetical protein